jgi:hypothetical protein
MAGDKDSTMVLASSQQNTAYTTPSREASKEEQIKAKKHEQPIPRFIKAANRPSQNKGGFFSIALCVQINTHSQRHNTLITQCCDVITSFSHPLHFSINLYSFFFFFCGFAGI